MVYGEARERRKRSGARENPKRIPRGAFIFLEPPKKSTATRHKSVSRVNQQQPTDKRCQEPYGHVSPPFDAKCQVGDKRARNNISRSFPSATDSPACPCPNNAPGKIERSFVLFLFASTVRYVEGNRFPREIQSIRTSYHVRVGWEGALKRADEKPFMKPQTGNGILKGKCTCATCKRSGAVTQQVNDERQSVPSLHA